MNRTTVAKATRESLLAEIDAHRTQLTAALPPGTDVDRFLALVKQAVSEQPRLLECSTSSVLRALGQCAASGLPLDGRFSSLIVRQSKTGKPTATFDPSFRGMIWLALESGIVLDVQSGTVREGDDFTFELGTEPKLVHRPSLLPKHGDVVAAYATAKLNSGRVMVEILTLPDIARIKQMSPAGDKGPWNANAWFDQMARKSAVRRLLKRLPAGAVRLNDLTAPANINRLSVLPDSPAPQSAIAPEDENRIECRAIALISDADSDAALQAAWTAIRADYAQAGVPISIKAEAKYHDRREAIGQAGQHDY
jgi:recombination protein RecT